jgi:hypothetical protein
MEPGDHFQSTMYGWLRNPNGKTLVFVAGGQMQTGKNTSGLLFLALLLFGLAAGPTDVNGQIGGFLKKKAKDIMNPNSKPGDTNSTDQSGGQAAPRRDDTILVLSPENITKLKQALEAEQAAREKVKSEFSREKYEKCQQQTMMSQDARQISETYKDNYSELSAKVMALLEQKCGKSPNQNDESAALKDAKSQAARNSGLTDRQYSMLIERVVPFCKVGGQEKVQGFGTNMYYTYSPDEVSALKPECSSLMPMIQGIGAGGRQ